MRFTPIFCAILLSACATGNRTNELYLGMTKPEVIRIMGKPISTSAADGTEYMRYSLAFADRSGAWTDEYFVRIFNGKVDAFGKTGDFDSTRTPAIDVNIGKK